MSNRITSNRPGLRLVGQERPDLQTNLISLEILESENRPARCIARFLNWGEQGFIYFNSDQLSFGSRFEVDFDSNSGPVEVFQGRILTLRGLFDHNTPPTCAIEAEDDLNMLAGEPRTRVFNHPTLMDIIQGLASDHALQPDIQLQDTYPLPKSLVQFEESDFSFLRRLVSRFGLKLRVRDDRLVITSVTNPETEIRLVFGRELLSVDTRASLEGQFSELAVSGWDVFHKQPIMETANKQVIQSELDSRRSAADYLMQSLQPRSGRQVNLAASTPGEASALAGAAFAKQARRFVIAQGITQGNPELRVGCKLILEGLGDYFQGSYFVQSVRHRFDLETGYTVEFSAYRPGLEAARSLRRGAKGIKNQMDTSNSQQDSSSRTNSTFPTKHQQEDKDATRDH